MFITIAGIALAATVSLTTEEPLWPEVTPEWGAMQGPRSSFSDKNAMNRRLSRSKHVIECEKFQAIPATATAGERVKIRMDFLREPPETLPFAAQLFFDSDRGVAWREELALGKANVYYTGRNHWRLEFELKLPLYINTGDYTLEFVTDAFVCPAVQRGDAYRTKIHIDRIKCDPDFPEPIVAKSEMINGSPRFTLNGKPFFAQWGNVNAERRPDGQCRHSEIGLNLIIAKNGIGCGKFWSDIDKFDTACFDAGAEAIRRENPGAYFFANITLYPPQSWKKKYPEEMAKDEFGVINEDEEEGELNYSYASERALNDLENAYAKAIEYIESTPYANRVIGYRINSGHTTEWLAWDPVNRKSILDFSEPMKRGFAKWAKEKFPTLKDVSIPTKAERFERDGKDYLVWDQQKHLKSIAFNMYYSHLTAQAMIRMCKRAKAIVGGRKLIGSYYGYVMTLNGGGASHARAHYALKEVLDADCMDFVMSPQNYGCRSLADFSSDMKPFRAFQNHGIVTSIEDDTRTHNAQELIVKYSQTLTEAQTIGVLTRNMSQYLCRNEPNFYYEHTLGCDVDFPAFIPYAKAMKAVGQHCVERASKRNAEIALIVSENSMMAMPMFDGQGGTKGVPFPQTTQYYDRFGKPHRQGNGGRPLCGDLYVTSYLRYAKAGAPVDYLLAEDIDNIKDEYKLYIFPNCWKPSKAIVEAAKKLRERNCTIVWQYAPGFISEDGNSVANMKALTGMEFKEIAEPIASKAKLGDGRTVGYEARFAPHFAAIDADEKIGAYAANGETAIARKRTGKAETYFVGVDYIDQHYINELYRKAGVHVYSETLDPIEANENLVTIYAHTAGKKAIRLPKKTAVVDIFEKKLVSESTDSFEFEMPIHSTKLFYYGDDAKELLK